MATNENLIPIPGRLHSVATEGHVAGADEIYDDTLGITLDQLSTKHASTGTTGDYPYNGMGRILLKKNMVFGVNTLTQSMMQATNTIYVIQYDFTLGEDITIPANCVLEFDGGSISASGNNDTITGQNTDIQTGLIKIFNTGIILAGTWKVAEVYPEWFGAKGDGVTDDSEAFISTFSVANSSDCSIQKIVLQNVTYIISTELLISADGITVQGNQSVGKDEDYSKDNDFDNSPCIKQIGNCNIINISGLTHHRSRIHKTTIENINLVFDDSVKHGHHAIYSEDTTLLDTKINNIVIKNADNGIYLFSTEGSIVGYTRTRLENILGYHNNTLIKVFRDGPNDAENRLFTWINSNHWINICSNKTRHNAIHLEGIMTAQNFIIEQLEMTAATDYDYNTIMQTGFQAIYIKNVTEGNLDLYNCYLEEAYTVRSANGIVNEYEETDGTKTWIKVSFCDSSPLFGIIVIDSAPHFKMRVLHNIFNLGEPIKVVKKANIYIMDNDFYYVKNHKNYIIHDISANDGNSISKYKFDITDTEICPIISKNTHNIIEYNAFPYKSSRKWYLNDSNGCEFFVSCKGDALYPGVHPNCAVNSIAVLNGRLTRPIDTLKVSYVETKISDNPETWMVEAGTQLPENVKNLIINLNNKTLHIGTLTYFCPIGNGALLESLTIINGTIVFDGNTSRLVDNRKKGVNITLRNITCDINDGSNTVVKDQGGAIITFENCTITANTSSPSKHGAITVSPIVYSVSSNIYGLVTMPISGSTANRPGTYFIQNNISVPIGFQYFDTDLNKPIYVKEVGAAVTWVDATGATV